MEHDVANNYDNCFVCSNYMSLCKNMLMVSSQISGNTIYKFIELFADVKLSNLIKTNAGICQDCLIKFEEYDQFRTKAEAIQQELLLLFRNTRETFVYIKQERELDEPNDTVHIKLPEFVKLTKIPDIKFHCKSCNKDFRNLSQMKLHSHTTKTSKHSLKNIDDDPDVCKKFQNLAKKSGINYDVETFHKMFGFSSDKKSNFKKIAITTRKESNEKSVVSKDFKEVTKQAGFNYDIEVFQKAFGIKVTDIDHGQDSSTDTSDNESSIKNITPFNDQKKVKKVKVESIKPFRCESCDKNFKSIEFMKVHLASDHDKIKKALKCPDCPKILADRANLRGHLAIHSETRNFFCDRCAKSFIHKESFRHHLLTHDDIRNFPCEQCSKSFRTKSKLTRHSYIHTNQRNHVCEYCSARFTQRFTMVLHVRKQHKNDQLPIQVNCPICELSVDKNMLKQHLCHTHQVINE